jgi:hypothetical protein
MGSMSCVRLRRDGDLLEAEDPRGGVSVLEGRPLWWVSSEEVTWPLTFGGYILAFPERVFRGVIRVPLIITSDT